MIMVYLKVAFRNLRAHWRQSWAAILSVAMSFFATVVIGGFIEQSKVLLASEYRLRLMSGDINIEKKGTWSPEGRGEPWKYQIDKETLSVLQPILDSHEEIRAWSKFLRVGGSINTGEISVPFWGIGADLNTARLIRTEDWEWNTMYGLPLEKSSEDSVLLGKTLASSINCVPASDEIVKRSLRGYEPIERPFRCTSKDLQLTTMTPSGQLAALNFNVAGIISAGYRDLDSRFLIMSLERAQALYKTDDISYISVLLKDESAKQEVIQDLKKTSDELALGLVFTDWKDHFVSGSTYRKLAMLLDVYEILVFSIIIIVAVLSVFNTFFKMVKERAREIGTWRSLGFRSEQLLGIFTCEAILLCLFGCFGAALLATASSLFINSLDVYYQGGLFVEKMPLSLGIHPFSYISTFLLLVVCCASASYIATRGIVKKGIIHNLISN